MKTPLLRPPHNLSVSTPDFSRMMAKARGAAPIGLLVRIFAILATARASIILSAAIALAALCVYAVYPRPKADTPKPRLESQIPDDQIPDRRNLRNVELNTGHI